MRIAIVYDRVNKWGGAERVLLALHEIWPDAPLFTAVYDPARAGWAEVFKVHTSFLQHIPFAKSHHEILPWLTPMAFESFTFDGFDIVLSVTSAEAKDIVTKPGTIHVCYCLTPTRYLWSGEKEYIRYSDKISSFMFRLWRLTLKRWDLIAASRPDYYIAISNHVADRIRKYYHRKVENVIYPPIDIRKFRTSNSELGTGNYFLCVSRLVPYKRVDIVIDAFNKLGWPLKIIGTGSEEGRLRAMAKKNIEFVSDLTDAELAAYYQRCASLVFAGDEDFGLISLEAQACGKPVLCPRSSGMAETIIEGKTGELFDRDLIGALERFKKKRYDSDLCRKHAEEFSVIRFQKEMKEEIMRLATI